MKKMHLLIFAAAASLLFLLTACEKEDPSVTFDKSTLEMTDKGGTESVSMTANYDWTANTSDPWIQVSPTSGKKGTTTLTIRVDASDRSSARKGTVTISCRELTRGVAVNQLPHLSQSLRIKHTGNAFNIPVLSGSSLSAVVKWGDGSEEKYDKSLKHTYAAGGSHTIELQAAGALSFKLESVAGVSEIEFTQF